jgi:hypothetical protein
LEAKDRGAAEFVLEQADRSITRSNRMLLIAGGEADPNILWLAQRLAGEGLPHVVLGAGTASVPRIVWRLADDRLWINGAEVHPTAVFLRYDVFTHIKDPRPERQKQAAGWYHTILSWALAHDDVAFLNRRYGARQTSKPYVLHLASRLGLAIPDTLVTNDGQVLDGLDAGGWIAKPVTGGAYTVALADVAGEWRWGESPAIVQRRMVAPDLRIYRVGAAWFAFALRSEQLDYRSDAAVEITPLDPPAALTEPLGNLMEHLGLDFGAADFKRCPDTGEDRFLEVNSAPMFAAFDRVATGALSGAILDWLMQRTATPPV